MNAVPAQLPVTRSERRIALITPAVAGEDQAAHAMKLLDSVLWVFKGTTQSNWIVGPAATAQVIVVHQDEPAQHVAKWRSEGKLIVVISTGTAASSISPYTLTYPFPTVQVLGILEQLDAELDSAAAPAGRVSASSPGNAIDGRGANHGSGDAWGFVESLRTLRLVKNADMWLVGKGSGGAQLWLQGDGSRYCCNSATAVAIRKGTHNFSELTLRKTVAPPAEMNPRSGAELAWFEGYHASAQIAPWLSERAKYRLTRWPDLGRVRPDDPQLRAEQIRVLAALDAAPATVAQLSARINASPDVAVRTLNALAGCELVKAASTPAPTVASTKPASPVPVSRLQQFLRNMRRHLGLSTSS